MTIRLLVPIRSSFQQFFGILAAGLCLAVVGCTAPPAQQASKKATEEQPKASPGIEDLRVKLARLEEDVLHLEIGPAKLIESPGIYQTPMLLKQNSAETAWLASQPIGNAALTIEPRGHSCFVIRGQAYRPGKLAELCVTKLEKSEVAFTLSAENFTHGYGLGQQFFGTNRQNGDLMTMKRSPGTYFGNKMVRFDRGAVGNTQIPIAFFLNETGQVYGLFFDNVYGQTWDFRNAERWKISGRGEAIRLLLIPGPEFSQARQRYMELSGKPPVPPRKMFGLWASEFGFDSWREVDRKVNAMRSKGFPLDGVMLDLQWFGGIARQSPNTQMGSLSWDTTAFPEPRQKIQKLRDLNVGTMLIEESYVGRGLEEHQDLEDRGFLVRSCAPPCKPLYLTAKPWWGKGGMIDWSNSAAAEYWHVRKRQPLIADGVIGHWTDLGEPEQFSGNAWYFGYAGPNQSTMPNFRHAHAANHNLYNFFWSQSIYEGYQEAFASEPDQSRPFILTRSGTAGSQRFATAFWSGDISSSFSSFQTQANAQMHMTLSGIDYYGSDIGGFHRGIYRIGDPELDDLYTQWFAASAMTDVPIRPHAENLCNCRRITPDEIGHIPSNLANLRLRYRLIPYLYALAHRAHRFGEPVFPPLVYYYPEDENVRQLSRIKMLGKDLLTATVAQPGIQATPVYLPAGKWFDFYSHEARDSQGEWTEPLPLYSDNKFRLPLFAQAGAIIPMQTANQHTIDSTASTGLGERPLEHWLRIYPDVSASQFTLYQDDGASMAYLSGAVRETGIRQQQVEGRIRIDIGAAQGRYEGAKTAREFRVELVTGKNIAEVQIDQKVLPKISDRQLAEGEIGWGRQKPMLVQINLGERSADREIQLEVIQI